MVHTRGLRNALLCLGSALLGAEAVRSSSELSELASELASEGRSAPAQKIAPRRFLQVSDLHGDFDMAQLILKDLGVLGEDGGWSGGNALLVQTGDIIDRGNHSKAIYDLFFRLQDEAPKSGGEVILMLGNHELWHIMGMTKDFSKQDRENWGGKAAYMRDYALDGYVGKRVSEMPSVLRVGEERGMTKPILFVHAGLTHGTAVSFKLIDILGDGEEFNTVADRVAATLNKAMHYMITDNMKAFKSKEDRRKAEVILGDMGPVWNRKIAQSSRRCDLAARTLSLMEATRIVMGHTIQEEHRVNEFCQGRVLLTDVAISAAFTGTPHPSSMEYYPDGCSEARYPKIGDPAATEVVKFTCAGNVE